MADSTRYKIIQAMESQLRSIQIANGYNTQPKFCADAVEAEASAERMVVWLQYEDETFPGQALSNRFQSNFGLVICASVMRDAAGNPLVKDIELLLQDVRNAVMSYRSTFPSVANGAGMEDWGTCATNVGMESATDSAEFVQRLTFVYNAGTTF